MPRKIVPIISVSAKAEMLVKKGHKVTVFTTNSNLDEDLDVPTGQAIDVNGVEVWYFKREALLKKWLFFIPYISKSMGYLYAPKMRSALDELVSFAFYLSDARSCQGSFQIR